MNLVKLLVFAVLTVRLVKSTPSDLRNDSSVIIESIYHIPIQEGVFYLFEVSDRVIELKEYPAFYFEEGIFPQGTLIKNINRKIIGYTIGNYENYYPITQLEGTRMHCGNYNPNELARAREIIYRGRRLKSMEHLQRKVKLNNNVKCYVYV